ncbi:hypothetical protein QFC22_002110 [Naganishia vaughanmartiniae]|uniref:Uncharacterized protein n=1 Tax=Naganishia vaughanmartiniae TaxID=1424756 RepID=A0ACC2XBV5_9TREE|nr:hypothetical protein QFC22_002110 [Naganishia vaughanmartiniae]
MIWNLHGWNGYYNWTGIAGEGVWLEVDSVVEGLDIEVGVDTDGPIHIVSPLSPMLGDTTSTQSLLLSPIIAPLNISQPTYPNYRIASPYPVNATIPTDMHPMRVVIVPTSESPDTSSNTQVSLGNSMCAVKRAENRTGSLAANRDEVEKTHTSVLQRPEGWRWGFVTEQLQAEVNYTAWVVQDNTGDASADMLQRGSLSQRIMFRTKEDGFPCPLAHSLALCPSIAYAAALDPSASANSVTTSLPDSVTEILVSSLNAFSTSLLAQACGRDLFSPVWTLHFPHLGLERQEHNQKKPGYTVCRTHLYAGVLVHTALAVSRQLSEGR